MKQTIKLFFGILLLWVLLYQVWVVLHILWWVDHNPESTAFMAAQLEVLQERAPDAKLKQHWVPYAQISQHLKRAVIAAEDSQFVVHQGFDWVGIETAFEKNLKKGRIVAGGSTISQQLAKNLFLSGHRTPWRKAQEAVITFMLEKLLSKRRILELYLNVIEWGEGVFGAEAAARHYFHSSARALTSAQSARLAAMVPNPRFYDAHRSTRYLNRHAATIQARMRLVKIP
ncbi:monofunctional biosynthetic peptidoglycan transglycosylase [Methylophilus medardicus]|uniref:Biosynthetic peptidoglycan transglycosylase n=1 Tax=Methylophilus medardicus TaxID=2588534 RepID=A0A5B8CUX8_9PROT|nr:monofunctional biosynthetic peptidoglycan transglycosylase [Methylophilus medardicus]QDC45144.1 monofunctional biosynthetic peptidoglycan transglycosylase [Methylophilus medardicus]QDC50151.1 monofunctional biosynthetic peptidoglycan transglycosylase [Methylophilus medardicus]QDC53856.1 monofunctional biosynthetic peptidoglycan transglycosylase [Methylophilus medardicus]